MVKIVEDPIKMDDVGVFHPYFGKYPYALKIMIFQVSLSQAAFQKVQMENQMNFG